MSSSSSYCPAVRRRRLGGSWWGVWSTITTTMMGTARGFPPPLLPTIASATSCTRGSFRTMSKTTIRPLFQRRQESSALCTTVEIWDDVWTTVQCQELHQQAVEHNDRIQDDSLVFVYTPGMTIPHRDNNDNNDDNDDDHRTSSAGSSLTPLEFAIASILDQLRMQDDNGDDGQPPHDELSSSEHDVIVVEYWCRQDYLDLQVHSDIDEEWFQQTTSTSPKKNYVLHQEEINKDHNQHREDGHVDPSSMASSLRYPQFGHILYLLAANNPAAVGPTCIFPTKLGGWDTTVPVPSTHSREESGGRQLTPLHETDLDDPKDAATSGSRRVPLIVVPFVPGRLVRFQGSAMHGVPKPLHKWFLSKDEQEELEWRDDEGDDEEDDDEHDDEHIHNHSTRRKNLRSVILFNLWNQTGPMGVPTSATAMKDTLVEGDRAETMPDLPEGIVLWETEEEEEENDANTSHHEPTSNVSAEIQDQSIAEGTVVGRHSFKGRCRSAVDWTKAPWIESLDVPFMTSSSSTNRREMTDSRTSTVTRLTIPLMGTKRRRLHSKKFVILDSQTLPPSRNTNDNYNNPETQEGGYRVWTRTAPMRFWLEQQPT